ncbi:MAG: hypothetical protein JWQ23_2646 [Herminiimonas sp.]|nr:hypothetical protein [Herminiimonas sp.]
MRKRTLLLLVVLAAIGLFAAVNWTAFNTPTTLSLIVTTVQAPLGVIMLVLTILVAILFLVFATYLQTSMLFETRNHAREMQAQRKLADEAEASRITALQNSIAAELQRLSAQSAASHTALLGRLEQAERELAAAVEQSGNTLAAYIGELEDRLERIADAPGPPSSIIAGASRPGL